MTLVRDNLRVLCILLVLVTGGAVGLSTLAFNYDSLQLPTVTWLFLQGLFLYVVYLSFQTLFFERFIACFRWSTSVSRRSSSSGSLPASVSRAMWASSS